MAEERKFNFVYERRTQEDNEFIKTFKIYGEYHYIDITRLSYMWTVDRTNDMYLIYNDAPNVLILEGVTGGMVTNFIYKNKVNWIEYERNYDSNNNIKYIKFLKVEMDKNLVYEKEYVLKAIKEAMKIMYEGEEHRYKCVLENDIEKIYYL